MSYLVDHWSFDPFIVVVAVIVVVHEIGLSHLKARSTPERTRRRRLRSLAFYGGLGVLLLAVASPVEYWSDDYFFVHIIEHILVSFYAPILVVLGAPWLPLVHGIPVRIRRRALRGVLLSGWARPLRAVGRFALRPWVGVIAFNVAMVLWHVPALFDVAESNQALHVWVMDASFFVTGLLLWLQIIPSYPIRPKLSYVGQAEAIIGTNVVMFLLAMSLSIFTASSWYSVYDHVRGVTLSPFADQQLGAAILWVCGDFWAIPALVVVFKRMIDAEGGASNALERLLRRPLAPSLEEFRAGR